MGLLRVFPRRNSHTPRDRLAFVGDPPLFRPKAHEVEGVHISVAFTWDLREAERLKVAWSGYYPVVKIGGPALGDQTALDFVPGRYVKEGVTFTTRGCDRRCPWCLVPSREGGLVEIRGYPPGWIIQDNNFLQASREHQAGVFEMLRRLKGPQFMAARGVEFAGGIDVRLVNPWFAEQLETVRLHQVFLAADTSLAVKQLEEARKVLHKIPQKKLRAYTLIGFGNDTIAKATARLERVWELGCIPHAQLYQPDDSWIEYSYDWLALSRLWSRPALMYGLHKAVEKVAGPLIPFGGR